MYAPARSRIFRIVSFILSFFVCFSFAPSSVLARPRERTIKSETIGQSISETQTLAPPIEGEQTLLDEAEQSPSVFSEGATSLETSAPTTNKAQENLPVPQAESHALPNSYAAAAAPVLQIIYNSNGLSAEHQGVYLGESIAGEISYTFAGDESDITSAVWSAVDPSVVSITGTAKDPVFTAVSEGGTLVTLTVTTATSGIYTDTFVFSAVYNDYDAPGVTTAPTELLRGAEPSAWLRTALASDQNLTVWGRAGDYYLVEMPSNFEINDTQANQLGYVPVSDVAVSASRVELDAPKDLYPGEQTTLVPRYFPIYATRDKALTWASSNTAVATISSSGVATARASGTTTLSVTLGSGARASVALTVHATSPLKLKFVKSVLLKGASNALKADNTFSFNAVEGATSYSIYRTHSARTGYVKLKEIPATTSASQTFTDTTTAIRDDAGALIKVTY